MDIDMPLEDIIKKQGSSKGPKGKDPKGKGRGQKAKARAAATNLAETIKRPAGAIKKAGRGKGGGERGSGGRGGGQRGGGGGGGGRGSTPHAPRGRAAGGRGGGSGGSKADGFKKAPPGACLVGAETDIKKSAGYVCTMLRAGTPPPVMGIGPPCVNQATKLLALAHSYLEEEELDLYAQVDFPEYAESSASAMVKLHVFQKAKRTSLAEVSEQIFVSATSEPDKVSGYIANCVREGPAKARLCITVAGPQPVLRALKAIFLARHHLAEDKLDLSIIPEFGKSDEGVSLVNIFVLSHAPGARL